MKTPLKLFIAALLINQLVKAQVPQKVVVEHFTNTLCSVCASRNPGFYTNLNKQMGVLHISIHPSAPYASCMLNQHNKVENDARTSYYGIYGSTPRFVIQGSVVPSNANINAQSLFDPYLNQTSPLAVSIQILNESSTSVKVEVVVKTVAAHSLGQLVLNASAVEEVLNFAAPNGEQKQYDVFRKNFWGAGGEVFSAPTSIGDSLVFLGSIPKSVSWTLNQIYALAMIQEAANKQIVQAERSALLTETTTTGIQNIHTLKAFVYPNPAQHTVHIKLSENRPTDIAIFNIAGAAVLHTQTLTSTSLNLEDLPKGLYFIKLTNSHSSSLVKLTVNE
jgi:hypothetical protein